MTNWYVGQLVGHDVETQVIGIIKRIYSDSRYVTVDWFSYVRGHWTCHNQNWNASSRHLTEDYPVFPAPYPKELVKLLQKFGHTEEKIFAANDSPLIKKIKLLDYKWEQKMKAKNKFFLTSRIIEESA